MKQSSVWRTIAAWAAGTAMAAGAQTCTTQAKMVSGVRQAIAARALEMAQAIKAGDATAISKQASSSIANNFGPTGFLIRNLSESLGADTVSVQQVYELDANAVAAGQVAEFACPLTGAAGEVDFGIDGLPKGLYAFAMVQADGPRPWLISMLLEQDGGEWKLAGLYPHPRAAAGHDGLWWWTDARAKAKAGQPWTAWLEWGLADELLRPAAFVSSTHLDKLRTERNTGAPTELRDGLSADTPLSLKSATGADPIAITALSLEPSEDGQRVNLVLHLRGTAGSDPAAQRVASVAAAKALLLAHPELRAAFPNLIVVPDINGQAATPIAFTDADLK